MEQLKYVKTHRGEVIMFPCTIQHSTFRDMDPVSAGFCRIMKTNKVICYGESVSLRLPSDKQADSVAATQQVFGWEAASALITE